MVSLAKLNMNDQSKRCIPETTLSENKRILSSSEFHRDFELSFCDLALAFTSSDGTLIHFYNGRIKRN